MKPVRVIGVIDLRGGQAVHARGGSRHLYTPVDVPGRTDARGDAIALATFYVRDLGLSELYVADLDAIAGAAPQRVLTDRLTALGAPVWLDAGIATAAGAADAVRGGVAHVVIGLETLPALASLREISDEIGGAATAFSLDMRDGQPLTVGGEWPNSVEEIAIQAVGAGAGALLLLDLARVGSGRGVDWTLIARLRPAAPDVVLLAGGGVAGAGDLRAAAEAGCDGVLMASALLDSRVTAADIHQASSSR